MIAIRTGLLGALTGSAALPMLAWLAVDLDRRAAVESILEESIFPHWTAVARAILADEPALAADLLAEIGERPRRPTPACAQAGPQAGRALRFYESAGAVYYVREAQRLLAASA